MNKINYLLIPIGLFVIIGIIVIWTVTGTKHLLLPDAERTKVYQEENYQAGLRKTQNAFDKLFSKDKSMNATLSPLVLGENKNSSLQSSVKELNNLFIEREGETIPDDQNFLPSSNGFSTLVGGDEEPTKVEKYVRVYPLTYVQFRRNETASFNEVNKILPLSTSISSPNNLGKDTIVWFENPTDKCSLNLETKQVDCEAK